MTKDEIISSLVRDGTIVKVVEGDYEYNNSLPAKDTVLTPSALLDKFIHDSKIPFNVKTSSGITYQLTAKSDYAKKFIYGELVTNPRFKYEDMTKATELYYNNAKMARVPLTKFFKEGVFEQVVQQYLNGTADNVIPSHRVCL